jgi:hypothetical protein
VLRDPHGRTLAIAGDSTNNQPMKQISVMTRWSRCLARLFIGVTVLTLTLAAQAATLTRAFTAECNLSYEDGAGIHGDVDVWAGTGSPGRMCDGVFPGAAWDFQTGAVVDSQTGNDRLYISAEVIAKAHLVGLEGYEGYQPVGDVQMTAHVRWDAKFVASGRTGDALLIYNVGSDGGDLATSGWKFNGAFGPHNGTLAMPIRFGRPFSMSLEIHAAENLWSGYPPDRATGGRESFDFDYVGYVRPGCAPDPLACELTYGATFSEVPEPSTAAGLILGSLVFVGYLGSIRFRARSAADLRD